MKKWLWIALVFVLLLGACTPAAPQDEAPVVEEEAEAAAPVEEEMAEEIGPAVGGTMVIARLGEETTLDPQRTVGGGVTQYIGASLVAEDPHTGELAPYLAETWTAAKDGMYWDFKLREDVKFHNGAPLTAQDFVWTIQRALDPETMSPTLGAILQGVAGAEALDDYTLRVNMAMPNYAFISNVSKSAYLQPLPQATLEEVGDDAFGRSPVGVGPFMFKEWITGEKIVLERNPDFTWGPAFSNGGPPYIETLEIRFIPENSTILAGLEAGEIDFAYIEDQDVQRLVDTGNFNILEQVAQGSLEAILINVTKPPFDDVRVRQALNLAVDRPALIQILESGNAGVKWGPISSSVRGYDPGVEEIGYGYDLEQAKALMAEAGFTLNADGMLEKDGEVLQIPMIVMPFAEQLATVLKEQYKQLGVDIQIQLTESGVWGEMVRTGDYLLSGGGFYWDEGTSLMFAMFHSSMVGALNYSQVADPELDVLLQNAMFAVDADANQEALNAAQQYVVEQALIVSLYSPKEFYALDSDVHDWYQTPGLWDVPFDAYIVGE